MTRKHAESVRVYCQDSLCGECWWVSIEWLTPDDLKKLADEVTCPECGTSNWKTSDWTEMVETDKEDVVLFEGKRCVKGPKSYNRR